MSSLQYNIPACDIPTTGMRYNSFTARGATIAARYKHNMLSFALGSMLKAAGFFIFSSV
jgi:hypothetical protein